MIYSKTTEEFIKFIQKKFENSSHKFVLYDISNSYINLNNYSDIIVLKNKKEILKFYLDLKNIKKYKKILIHGWYFPYLSLYIFFNRVLLKKIYWCIWGGDMRIIFEKKESLKEKILFLIDIFCKKRVKAYVCQFEEEYKLINNKFSVSGKYVETFIYPSNMYKEQILNNIKGKKGFNIQIGNSAQDRNHIEVLKKLIKNKNKINKIFLLLSYGDSNNYVEKLLKIIPKELEKKVYPILNTMPYNEYLNFLSEMDIIILPFKRQQAFGNIISLLSMEKTLYLNESSITYDFFKNIGIKLKNYKELDRLELLDKNILDKNKKIIKNKFSENKLLEDLEKIFNED